MRKIAVVVLALAVGCALVLWLRSLAGGVDSAAPHPGSGAPPGDAYPLTPLQGAQENDPLPDGSATPSRLPARVDVPETIHATCLELVILDSKNRPLPDSRIVLFRSGAMLGSEETDSAGIARFEPGEGEAEALVAAPERVLQREVVQLAPGRREVRIHPSARLAGRILLDGREPGERFELVLRLDHPTVPAGGVPDKVWTTLGLPPGGHTRLEGSSEQDGHFTFAGLRVDASGTLWFPRGFRLEESSSAPSPGRSFDRSSLRFQAPQEDLVVRLLGVPSLTGRVVEAATRDPIPDARVWGSIGFGNGNWASLGGTVNEHGYFRVPVHGETIAEGFLTVSRSAGPGQHSVDLTGLGPPAFWHLGDIAIEKVDTKSIRFRVTDSGGAPIEGAIAVDAAQARVKSAPTTADGLGHLDGVPIECKRIRVVALGYRVAEVPVPPAFEATANVVLVSVPSLEVRIRTADGDVPRGIEVTLSAPGQFFDDRGSYGPDRLYASVGATQYASWGSGPKGTEVTFLPDEAGQVRVTGLSTDASLRLRVKDFLEWPIHEQVLAPFGPSERRAIDIVLPSQPPPFAGIVTDSVGQPLAGARIRLSLTESSSRTYPVDGAGAFRFDGIWVERGSVRISKDGYCPLHVQDFVFPRDGRPAEYRLDPGRDLTVQVVDEGGSAVSAEVSADQAGSPAWDAARIEVGAYLLEDLPQAEVEVCVSVAGRDYTHRVDSRESELIARVPIHGSLHATVAQGVDPATHRCVVLFPLEQGLPVRREWVNPKKVGLGPVRIDPVLPGAYEACLQVEEAAVGQGQVTHRDATPRLPVTISPGAVSEIDLRL